MRNVLWNSGKIKNLNCSTETILNVDYVVLQDFNKISILINTYLQLQVVLKESIKKKPIANQGNWKPS